MKQRFKRKGSWDNCRSERPAQLRNNSLDFVIDPAFRNMTYPTRNSFGKYYMPLVENKDFNAVIHNKPCFDQSTKKQTC